MTEDEATADRTWPVAPADPWSRRFVVVLLVLLAPAPLVYGGLWEPDEGRYAEIGRGMLLTGDWTIPVFDDRPHLTKPPFAYWMAAIGIAVFGPNGFGARALAALFGLGVALLTMRLGRRLHDEAVGNLAALICGTGVYGFTLAHFSSADVFVAFWQALAVVLALAACDARDAAKRSVFVHLVWLAFGLAFLTKGPPGLLAAFAVASLARARARRGEPVRFLRASAVILFVVVAGWWYTLAARAIPGAAQAFLVEEVFERVFTTAHDRDRTPLIYLAALTLGVAPWFGPLARWLGAAWRALRRRAWPRTEAARLLAWWLLPSLAIFVLARSRQLSYVYPVLVPWSIALAAAWRARGPTRVARARSPWIPRIALVIWCAGLVIVNIAVRDLRRGGDARVLGGAIVRDAGERESYQVINAGAREFGSFGLWARAPHRVPHENRHRFTTDPGRLDALREPGLSPVYLILRREDVDAFRARRPGFREIARRNDLVLLTSSAR